jgi:hypothetical protein
MVRNYLLFGVTEETNVDFSWMALRPVVVQKVFGEKTMMTTF